MPGIMPKLHADASLRWATIALGASLPISVALDNLLLVVILVAWLLAGRWRSCLVCWRSQPVAWAALLLLALLLVGCAWGPGSFDDRLHFLRKNSHLLLLPVLLSCPWRACDRERAVAAFAAAMALTLVISYGYWLHLIPLEATNNQSPDNPVVFKLHITHGILMAYCAYLAAIAALLQEGRRLRLGLWAFAALATFNVLFMVQGRTGYLVLGGLATWLCFERLRWRGLAVAAGAGALLLASAYALHLPMVDRLLAMSVDYQQWRVGVGGETSIGARIDLYRTSLEIIAAHPLLGVGTGGFTSAYAAATTTHGPTVWNNPHNQYLLTTVQLGVVGLCALVALFAAVWRSAAKLAKAPRLAAQGLLLTIALGCLLNSLLIDHTEGLFFSWLAGMLLGPSERAGDGATIAARQSTSAPPP